ncbi:hypothetical protein P9112_002402 [Eukaryota sp. TZLM1-RC]
MNAIPYVPQKIMSALMDHQNEYALFLALRHYFNTQSLESKLVVADILIRMNEYRRAVEWTSKLNSPHMRYLHALAQYHCNNSNACICTLLDNVPLELSLKHNRVPHGISGLFLLAKAFKASGNFDQADQVLTHVLTIEPCHFPAHQAISKPRSPTSSSLPPPPSFSTPGVSSDTPSTRRPSITSASLTQSPRSAFSVKKSSKMFANTTDLFSFATPFSDFNSQFTPQSNHQSNHQSSNLMSNRSSFITPSPIDDSHKSSSKSLFSDITPMHNPNPNPKSKPTIETTPHSLDLFPSEMSDNKPLRHQRRVSVPVDEVSTDFSYSDIEKVAHTLITAHCQVYAHNSDRALTCLESLPFSELSSPDAVLLKARALIHKFNYSAALDLLYPSFMKDPWTEFIPLISICLWACNDQLRLNSFVHLVEEVYPRSCFHYFLMGNYDSLLNKHTKAIESFQRCVDSIPFDSYSFKALTLALLGTELLETEDVVAAKESLLQAVSVDSRCLSAWLGLSSLEKRSNRFDLAVSHLQMALAIAPKNVLILTELAKTLLLLFDCKPDHSFIKHSEQHLSTALSIDSRSIPALVTLTRLYRKIGKLVDAKNFVNRALVVDPQDPGILKLASEVEFDLGNGSEAFSLALKASVVAPNDPEITGWLRSFETR